MSDLISRQAAIDAVTEYGNGRTVYIGVEEAVRRIEQLPSAQPEIIRCKDCAHYGNDCVLLFPADGYCYDGKRRDDERPES